VNKKDFSESDICTKFITPALAAAGWDIDSQVRERLFARPAGKDHAPWARPSCAE
jgi:type I site-specific restriction endonuclease